MISIKPCNAVSKTDFDSLFTKEAIDYFATLHKEFNPTREALLKKRVERFEN